MLSLNMHDLEALSRMPTSHLLFSVWEENEKHLSYQIWGTQILELLNINRRSILIANMSAIEIFITKLRNEHGTLTSYLKYHKEWFFYPSLWLQITIHWQEKNRCLKLELYVYCQSYGRDSDCSHPRELLFRYPRHCPVVIS